MIGSAKALATSGFSGRGADGGGAGGSEKWAFTSLFDFVGEGRDLSDPDLVSFVGDSALPLSIASIVAFARWRSCDCCIASFSSAWKGKHVALACKSFFTYMHLLHNRLHIRLIQHCLHHP